MSESKRHEPTAFEFRAASLFDVPALAELAAASFKVPWSGEMIASSLAAKGSAGLCAIYKPSVVEETATKSHGGQAGSMTGALKGALIGRVMADEAEILFLAVAPEFRRRNLGRELLQRQLSRFDAAQIGKVYLEVAQSNEAARRLYQQNGFETVGVRPNYYSAGRDVPENALIMMRRGRFATGSERSSDI